MRVGGGSLPAVVGELGASFAVTVGVVISSQLVEMWETVVEVEVEVEAAAAVVAGGWVTVSMGLVQVSSFQFVCRETLSHSPSSSHNRCSSPFIKNHHRFVSGLTFLRIVIRSTTVVSFFRVDVTAVVVVAFSVPQTLLTPSTGTLSCLDGPL